MRLSGADTGGAKRALAPPRDCKIYDVVKSAKPSISIIGWLMHILFKVYSLIVNKFKDIGTIYNELSSKTHEERYLLLKKILAQQSINDHVFKKHKENVNTRTFQIKWLHTYS